VNFFAAARILANLDIVRQDNLRITNLFSSMAAADVLLMAFYFSSMTGLMSWSRMKVWFPGRYIDDIDTMPYINSTAKTTSSDQHYEQKSNHKYGRKNKHGIVSSGLFAASLAWIIVETSIIFEKYTSHILPGMGCAVVAAMGTSASVLLGKIPYTTKVKNNSYFWTLMKRFILYLTRDLKRVSIRMSEICFHLLFAAIGSSTSIGAALCHGPTTFAFAALALLIHILFICFGSLWTMKAVRSGQHKIYNRILPLSIEEVLVASNAAIGGATTAAAFAASLGGGGGGYDDNGVRRNTPPWSNEKKRGLIMAATVWGVFGYACATAVGVVVAKILLFLLVK